VSIVSQMPWKNPFACFGTRQRKVIPPRLSTLESQYEFLSIASGIESVAFYSPRSSREVGVTDARPIHHHTITLNGIRYHPYSSQFSYNCDAVLSLIHSESVPYDLTVYDALEQELRLWVVNRYKDPPPCIDPSSLPSLTDLPEPVIVRVQAIYDCSDEDEVMKPMQMLESLRTDLSKDMPGITEDERYRTLDFLVIDECMRRLRWKYPRVKTVVGLIASIPTGASKQTTGWHYEDCHGIDMWTKAESDGSFSVRCRSVQNQPLFNAISLINEVDLHPDFMPHLRKATRLHTIQGCGQRAQLLAHYLYHMPFPLTDRDVVLYAFGCVALDVEGVEGIIISAQSVPMGLDEWWGYSIPDSGKLVREQLRGISFIMKPLDDSRTELTIIANLDKQIALIPKPIMHFFIKDMIKGLYKNMIKLNLKFDKTQFAKRVEENREFYDWVKMSILRNARKST
jgi:hypothetical protein